MIAPRWIAFLISLSACIAIHLFYARLVGMWQRPTINEASEVFGYYFVILHAVIVGIGVVAFIAFPQAVAADRLLQSKKRGRYSPYLLFCAVAVVITGTLLTVLEGEKHPLDVPSALIYFAVAPAIIWKIAYELPKEKRA